MRPVFTAAMLIEVPTRRSLWPPPLRLSDMHPLARADILKSYEDHIRETRRVCAF